ncbi:MAG: SDR family oxidoreductase [Sandaracinaceae bacterium]|nr:SDR family oxidoreductase [Sandaracinaceae bacterium]
MPQAAAPPMRVLITGAHGYLGERLGRELSARGLDVGALVRRPTPAPAFASEVVVADITRPIAERPRGPFDVLVHLAAANDVASRDPETALRVTTLGTRHVLDLCAAHGIPRVLYVSTTQVYGADAGVVDESTPPAPRNDYALTHLFAEHYVRASRIRWAIARPGNIFGTPSSRAQERWTLVPSCFCLEAHDHGRITLMSSGLQLRDFLGAGDVARLLAAMTQRFDELEGVTLNLTSGRSVTVRSVAERVAARFALRTGRACAIDVRSSAPAESGALSMPTALRERLGFVLDRHEDMDDEIDKTFAVLEAS